TSGVVLMTDITSCSSPEPPTLIAICKSSRPAAHPYGGAAGRQSLLAHRCGRGRRPWGVGIAGADAGTAYQIGMQIAGEVPQRFLQELVAAEQPVVAHDRRHRHE